MSFSMTAPKSLRELFDQLGLQEVPSTSERSTPPVGFRAA